MKGIRNQWPAWESKDGGSWHHLTFNFLLAVFNSNRLQGASILFFSATPTPTPTRFTFLLRIPFRSKCHPFSFSGSFLPSYFNSILLIIDLIHNSPLHTYSLWRMKHWMLWFLGLLLLVKEPSATSSPTRLAYLLFFLPSITK